jgi:hypothetical protein
LNLATFVVLALVGVAAFFSARTLHRKGACGQKDSCSGNCLTGQGCAAATKMVEDARRALDEDARRALDKNASQVVGGDAR